jgi:hypothetical protein
VRLVYYFVKILYYNIVKKKEILRLKKKIMFENVSKIKMSMGSCANSLIYKSHRFLISLAGTTRTSAEDAGTPFKKTEMPEDGLMRSVLRYSIV